MPDKNLPKPPKDLPEPEKDLPLPEKELTSGEEIETVEANETGNSHKGLQLLGSFIFGFLFVVLIVVVGGGSFLLGKTIKTENQQQQTPTISPTPTINDWATYQGNTFSLKYPKNYQLYENKIVATEGITEEQKNTIQLISPTLPNSSGNLSLIIAFKPTKESLGKAVDEGSTCAELFGRKLTPIKLGENTFSQSGLINCGPNETAFFYVLNNGNIYEVKVETTADYEKDALPAVKQILSTIKFTTSSPTPTCRPRPACLDAQPRCMIAETQDMCPPTPAK